MAIQQQSHEQEQTDKQEVETPGEIITNTVQRLEDQPTEWPVEEALENHLKNRIETAEESRYYARKSGNIVQSLMWSVRRDNARRALDRLQSEGVRQ